MANIFNNNDSVEVIDDNDYHPMDLIPNSFDEDLNHKADNTDNDCIANTNNIANTNYVYNPESVLSNDYHLSSLKIPNVTTSSSNKIKDNISDVLDQVEGTRLGNNNNYEVQNNYNNGNSTKSDNTNSRPSSLLSLPNRSSIMEKKDDNNKHNRNNDDDDNEQDNNNDNNNNNNNNSIDALLAKELNSLSFQQRESINEEIHGINVDQIYTDGKEIEEQPELLKESFKKLQIELNVLQTNSFAYNRCQQLYGDGDGDPATATAASTTTTNADIGTKKKRTTTTTTTTHINTDEFRIIFLRCELFDITKAARRLINFVELMYELYGDLGLQRRIRLDDLSTDESKRLQAGNTQIIKARDRAGRRILFSDNTIRRNGFTLKSRLRIAFYFAMSVVDDVETQRKGVVIVQWYQDFNIFNDFSISAKLNSRAIKCVPFRAGAVHLCIPETNIIPAINSVSGAPPPPTNLDNTSNSTKGMNNPSTTQSTVNTTIKSMMVLSIGSESRAKLRIHTGSAMECLYALQSFGLPSSQIPLIICSTNKRRRKKTMKEVQDAADNSGSGGGLAVAVAVEDHNYYNYNNNLKLHNHIAWFQLCQLKESNMKSIDKKWKNYDSHNQEKIIECPNHSDILSGRGKEIMKHGGNALLRHIVFSKLDEYSLLTSYSETTKLTLEVVHLLKNKYGARFLKEEAAETNGTLGCWIEFTDEQARNKVRIAFRDKIKVQQQLQLDQQQQQQQQQQQKFQQQQQTQMMVLSNMQKMTMMTTINNGSDKIVPKNNNNIKQKDELSRMYSPTPLPFYPLSSSSITDPSLILEQQNNNNNNNNDSFHHHQHQHQHTQQQHQQQQQHVEEDTDSSTSIFLTMNGGGRGSSSGSSGSKKRELPPMACYSYFDCMN